MQNPVFLVGVSGPASSQRIALTRDTTSFGRLGESDFVLSDQSTSRRHCQIERIDGDYLLRDLDSLHGTFVNGERAGTQLLGHGDRVTIGRSVFIFMRPDAGEFGRSASPLTDDETLPDLIALDATRDYASQAAGLSPEEAARVAADLAAVLRINRAIGSIGEPETLMHRLLELIAEVVPAQRGGILLLREGAETLEEGEDFASTFAWSKERETETGASPIRLSRSVAQKAVRERLGLLIQDVEQDGAWSESRSLAIGRVRSVLCVPLTLFERVTGVLYLDTSDRGVCFERRHLDLVTALAGTAAMALETARQLTGLERDNQRLREEVALVHDMVGDSVRMRQVLKLLARIAGTDSTVLILGESGTGKELVARAIHHNGDRASGPFVAINCAALPESLIESELFGHERGAFSGAYAAKPGRLELADGGTLFLDEVAELPLALQAKLLRVIQERSFDRVGGTRSLQADVRFLAATNADIEAAVKAGSFRSDLYYRLNVIALTVPPLRERAGDIPELALHFAERVARRLGRPPPRFSGSALACLRRHDWPGNVRELENVVERAVVLVDGETIGPEHLPEALVDAEAAAGGRPTGYHESVATAKKSIILQAMEQAGGVITEAARILELNPKYLHRLIKQLGVK